MENPQEWAVFARSSYEYGEAVRLIAEHGWPCSGALKEEDGFQDGFSHIFWAEEKQMLWLGRYPEAKQISLSDMPDYMLPIMDSVNASGSNMARVANIDEAGRLQEWVPAAPLVMRCEKGGCTNLGGREYKRKRLLVGWADEPIFLCDYHGQGRTPC